MQKFLITAWLALAVSASALAQQKTEQEEKIIKRFDSTMLRLGRINIREAGEVRHVATPPVGRRQQFDGTLPVLDKQAVAAGQQIAAKKALYIPQPSGKQAIDKDLLPLLSAMPEPIADLPAAKQEVRMSSDDNVYTRYIEKVKQYRKGLEDRARQELAAGQKNADELKKEAYQNQKEVNDMLANNPMIQQMGGMEKLKNMTPEQREALGKQMTEKLRQNPNAYVAQQPKTVTPGSRAADLAKRDKAAASIAIDQRVTAILEHAKEMAAIAGGVQQQTDSYFESVYKKLGDEYGARIKALPIIEMGEYGHDRDTYQTDMAYEIVLYNMEKEQAISDRVVWQRFLEAAKISIAEYNELLGDYDADSRLLAEKGITPASISAGLCDDIIRLAEMAKTQAGRNASRQRTFDEKVLHLYE